MHRLVLFAAIGIGLFLIIVFVQQREIAGLDTDQPVGEVQPEADYYFERTLTRHYDDQGRFDYQFVANRIEHFVEGDYTMVEAPRVSFYQENGTPWLIVARQGRASAGNEKVELWQDVRVNRNSDVDPLQMSTATLTLDMPSRVAQTDDPVQIKYPKGQVDAVGMKAAFQSNRMELLSQVKVRHEPIAFD